MRDLPDHPNTEEFSDSLSNPPYDPDPENRKKIGENRATFDFYIEKLIKWTLVIFVIFLAIGFLVLLGAYILNLLGLIDLIETNAQKIGTIISDVSRAVLISLVSLFVSKHIVR